ncbi:uncharacterized protein F4812DRAFT_99874 [Daldinia caldariorum]|uniref:uncharacterized protein n=1 Tax=Daldinia caldariorum TaxID=326644 RepID=UPI002008D692|nr:uncharacterized protein F4812DRAFT_99874 [Daldinia caldariorum]KAI1466203.1 hypothetical protein F4812DRAFT_99874 [Daldinia caldariorum]
MSSIAPSAENQPSLLIRMVMPYGVPTFRCPYCPMWFQKPGHFKNHLSKQHTAELAQVGIFLTLYPDTSNWMFEGMSALSEHPSPLQLHNNMATASNSNIPSPIPVHGSSRATAAPPAACQSTQFAIASQAQFSPQLPPQPRASSRNQRFTPAPQASSIAPPPPPPPPAPHAPPTPSHQAQSHGPPTLHGTFQPHNHAMPTMNGGIASPAIPPPPPPSNNPYGNFPTQNSSGFNQWQFGLETDLL